jgi:hypothetical protein
MMMSGALRTSRAIASPAFPAQEAITLLLDGTESLSGLPKRLGGYPTRRGVRTEDGRRQRMPISCGVPCVAPRGNFQL